MTDARFVPHSGALAEDMIDTADPEVSLPFEWSLLDGDGSGGPAVTDPLILDIEIPAMGDGDDPDAPMWRVALGDVIDEVISLHMWQDGTLDPEQLPMFTALRDALAAQADKLSILMIKGAQHERSQTDQPLDAGTRRGPGACHRLGSKDRGGDVCDSQDRDGLRGSTIEKTEGL
jgi:hypothetical protein